MLCQMKMKSRTGDGSLSRKRKEQAVRPALPLAPIDAAGA